MAPGSVSSARQLARVVLPPAAREALLHGIAAEGLREEELRVDDPDYPVSILIRAVKPAVEGSA